MFEGVFAGGLDATIHNRYRESGQDGHWSMVRRLTGASAVRRCYTRMGAAKIVSQVNANPVDYYNIDWRDLVDVRRVGRTVFWRQSHMAALEVGWMELPDVDAASTIAQAMQYLSQQCKL